MWIIAALVGVLLVMGMPVASGDDTASSRVLVTHRPGGGDAAASAVSAVGGTVDYRNDEGVVAVVPDSELAQLVDDRRVFSVVDDYDEHRTTSTEASDWEDAPGDLLNVATDIGATDLWAAGLTGQGVDVALVDTGVTPVGGLDGENKVFYGPDLSFEAGIPELANFDGFGHGTHMAGIIAGADPWVNPESLADPSSLPPSTFTGIAPGSRIVSVKAADNTGATDVSQVIAGIDWVIEHKDDNGLDIGVLLVAFGANSPLDYRHDPLAYAVERAWHEGIVVVVAGGNDGKGVRRLASPAIDPYVIAVGATDRANENAMWKVPKWSSTGDGERNPDVVAPGTSIISLRVPGSRADVEHPEGYVDERRFKGTGTSQAAAVMAGAAALLLEQRPDLTPDQVKAILTATARDVAGDAAQAGDGMVDLAAAAAAATPDALQTWERSLGDGSLEEARGGTYIYRDGEQLSGEVTAWGTPWDHEAWQEAHANGGSWTGGSWTNGFWNGGSWTGGSWTGGSWTGGSWTGDEWTGGSWTGGSWTGGSWTGGSWTTGDWNGGSWTGGSWTGGSWTGGSWTGGSWTGGSWTGGSWTGGSWTGGSWTGGSWTGGSWTGGSWTTASFS